MRRRTTLGACAAALAAGAAPALAAPDWRAVTLPAARQADIHSAATGQRYRVFVAEPPGPAPAAGRPVLYVLDGNAAFPVAALLARNVAGRSEVTGQIAPLVVGIGYPGDADFDVPARRRDYTPRLPAAEPSAAEGGAAAFLGFIEDELKPLIAARHRIDPQRQALFGHSFGGLFVLHALFTRPEAFSTYLASSPSIWWWGGRLPALRPTPARVQISVGALEDEPPPAHYPADMRALSMSRRMVEPARELAARLRALDGGADRVAFHELAGENHGSAWLPALSRGMQFFVSQAANP